MFNQTTESDYENRINVIKNLLGSTGERVM
ncbi:hypothetical protein AB1K32_26325 [Metabacillus dongyingensis]